MHYSFSIKSKCAINVIHLPIHSFHGTTMYFHYTKPFVCVCACVYVYVAELIAVVSHLSVKGVLPLQRQRPWRVTAGNQPQTGANARWEAQAGCHGSGHS